LNNESLSYKDSDYDEMQLKPASLPTSSETKKQYKTLKMIVLKMKVLTVMIKMKHMTFQLK